MLSFLALIRELQLDDLKVWHQAVSTRSPIHAYVFHKRKPEKKTTLYTLALWGTKGKKGTKGTIGTDKDVCSLTNKL